MTNRDDHISDAELAAMTAELDQMHRDEALPALRTAVGELVESVRELGQGVGRRSPSRRTFLLGAAGLGVGGVVLAACGSSGRKAPASAAGEAPRTTARLSGDLAVAAMAASLENLGVYAYGAGLKAARAGKLGSVPPAVGVFAETAMRQHEDHAKAWNAALRAASKPAVTVTDPALTPTVDAAFAKVRSAADLAELALLVENIAAQTYQAAIPSLAAASSIGVAATIQPVEMQHAAILYYVLGRYPGIQGTAADQYGMGTPLAFNPTTLARPVSDYTGA
jgi:hypothetical protein